MVEIVSSALLGCHGDGFHPYRAAERCLEVRVGCGLFAVYRTEDGRCRLLRKENAVIRAEVSDLQSLPPGNIDGVFRLEDWKPLLSVS